MGSSDDKSAEVFLPVLLFLLSLLRFEKNALNEKQASLLIQNDDNVAFEDCTSSSSHFLTLVVVKVKKGKKAKDFDRKTDSVSSCPKCSISSTALVLQQKKKKQELPPPPSQRERGTTSLPYLQAVVSFCRSSSSSTPTTPIRINIPFIITTDGGERGRRSFILVAQSDKETQQRKKSIQSPASQVDHQHQQLSFRVNDDCNNAGISGECTDTTALYRLPEITSTPPLLISSSSILLSFTLPNIQSSCHITIKAAKLLLCITAYCRVLQLEKL